MEQIFKCLICSFFGLLTFLLGDSLYKCPLLSVFLSIVGFFYSVSSTFRFEAYAYVLVSRRSLDFHERRTKNGYFTLHCNFINWFVYFFYLCLCR